MKKVKSILALVLLSALFIAPTFGQDMATATELYNQGAKALAANNYEEAIEAFNKSVRMIEALPEEDRGEEGDIILLETKSIIPQIHLRHGKGLAAAGDVVNSIKQLDLAVESAEKYGVEGVIEEVLSLKPQILLANASQLLNGGKLEEAVAAFNELLALSPENKDAYLRLGLAHSRLNDEEAALAAFEKAVEFGETVNAPRQIGVIYLKRSAAAVRPKKWAEVYENAAKANEFSATSNGYKLLGLSAVQLKKYGEAIEALGAYLAAEPAAKDKNSIMYNLATAHEKRGETGKACGYYKQIVNDPTFKQIAEYKINTELKCN